MADHSLKNPLDAPWLLIGTDGLGNQYHADVDSDGRLINKNVVWDTDLLSWVAMTQPVISTDTLNVSGDFSQPVYAVRVDEATATVMYVGEASSGAAENASSWRIKKVDTTSGTSITWADGNTNFDNRWDQRASLSYS
jgi:hypothetical protein